VARAVLLRRADRLLWVEGNAVRGSPIPIGATREEAVERSLDWPNRVPLALRKRLTGSPREGSAALGEPALRSATEALPLATLDERRAAREVAWARPEPKERAFYLALARRRVEEVLADPVEVLITLAREEERLERTLTRERSASEHFLAGTEGPLRAYTESWEHVRDGIASHHTALVDLLEAHARRVVPNLSALLGARVAARLVSRAGSRASLARMSSSKIQLLGSRRRPGPGRNPRFGLIVLADGMGEIPPDRQGAFARSLGSLAAIAVRSDETGTDRGRWLRERRDRRSTELRRRRAP
jgi:snoRNA binding domain, fibrillarin